MGEGSSLVRVGGKESQSSCCRMAVAFRSRSIAAENRENRGERRPEEETGER